MKTPSQKFRARLPWFAAASLGALLSAGVLYSATRSHRPGTQDKEARPSSPDQASNLNDQPEPAKLLHKYVGKEVTLVRNYQDSGTTKHEEIKATLLSDNNGPVWKIGNDIVTGMYAESYRFPEVPANLYERPTLLMSLENSGAKKQQIEASYLASNLSWNADYVLTVARDDKNADLDGWVTVVNNSGTAFHNARLQLVAGELNRVREG